MKDRDCKTTLGPAEAALEVFYKRGVIKNFVIFNGVHIIHLISKIISKFQMILASIRSDGYEIFRME